MLYLTRWTTEELHETYRAGAQNDSPHGNALARAIEAELTRRSGGEWTPAWNDETPEKAPSEATPPLGRAMQ